MRPGVVGQGGVTGEPGHRHGLGGGILRKGGAFFRDFREPGKIRQAQELYPGVRQERLKFPDLAGIAAGHHQGRGSHGANTSAWIRVSSLIPGLGQLQHLVEPGGGEGAALAG